MLAIVVFVVFVLVISPVGLYALHASDNYPLNRPPGKGKKRPDNISERG